ncbi:hypothetical protein [Jeotgalibaca caeni]|uniref:hypothetical protein n=1 Tax=Jeotgalibaca caeni TaxID=3028623 RepID=UPI00237DAE6B|nr:hypothetical protein [Jeotgalibaca caeni]MDE1549422.1 hypothetical protein [Jeotgalibaca caeni]
MKKTVTRFLLLLGGVFLVSGCTVLVDDTEVMDTIQTAAMNNQRLENGRFEFLLETDAAGEEKNIHQKTGGSFVKKTDGSYDWYYFTHFPGKYQLISSELVEKNRKQYQKVVVDPLEKAEWEPVSVPLRSFEGTMDALFEPQLKKSEIDAIAVNEEETGMVYLLTMNASYVERMKMEHINELKRLMKTLEKSETEAWMIENMEKQVEQMEETDYENFVITYVVDENECLSNVRYASSVTMPEGNSVRFEKSHSLVEYNVSNPSTLLPSIP